MARGGLSRRHARAPRQARRGTTRDGDLLSSATREVVIGFERPFVIIGERINPTGRKKLAEEMAAGNFDTVVADAIAQVQAGAQMLDVNAGIPLADEPAILAQTVELVQQVTDVPLSIDSSIVAALEAGLAVYQGRRSSTRSRARTTGSRPCSRSSRSTAPRSSRSRTTRRGSPRTRRALRGRPQDRLARGGPRDSEGGRRRRPARHADRGDAQRGPAGVPDRPPPARGARREHDVRRVQRELRAPEPDGAERGLPPDGDGGRADVGDHEPAPFGDAAGGEGGRRAARQRPSLRRLDRAQRRLPAGGEAARGRRGGREGPPPDDAA